MGVHWEMVLWVPMLFQELHLGTVQQILDERKIKTCQFGSTKWFTGALYNKFWMKEKSKHVNLAQQNGFVSAFLHIMMMMRAKGTAKPNTYC
jgi:hypothetical protein